MLRFQSTTGPLTEGGLPVIGHGISVRCLNPGGTPFYKSYRYVPPKRVGFLRRFGLKTGIDFAHFGLESSMIYEGTMIVYQCVCRYNSK